MMTRPQQLSITGLRETTGEAEARLQMQTEALCSALNRGQVPWLQGTALDGPAVLAATGARLSALGCLHAWHAADSAEISVLAWSLARDSQPEGPSAALPLVSKGGWSAYLATPSTAVVQLRDPLFGDLKAVPEIEPLGALLELDHAWLRLGAESQACEPIHPSAVVSLAQAILRPLGNKGAVLEPEVGGHWTSERLWRTATLAEALAWRWRLADVRPLASAPLLVRDGGRKTKSSFSWFPSLTPAERRSRLITLTHLRPLVALHPAEVRLASSAEYVGLPPELPLKEAAVNAEPLLRAPALGRSGKLIHFANQQESELAPALLRRAQVDNSILVALRLAEFLLPSGSPPDLGCLWRAVARQLRAVANRRGAEQVAAVRHILTSTTQQAGKGPSLGHKGAKLWSYVCGQHGQRSWMHPNVLTQADELSRARKRWNQEMVNAVVDAEGFGANDARPLTSNLPPVALSEARLPKQPKRGESQALQAVAHILQAEQNWQSVLAKARGLPWRRHPIAKSDGSARWLDVPAPALKEALQVLATEVAADVPSLQASTAFRSGGSPVIHARAHAGARMAVQADIEDFFGSITRQQVEAWLVHRRYFPHGPLHDWTDEARQAVAEFAFRQGTWRSLPQGSPLSPALSNLAGYWLDRHILHECAAAFGEGGFRYSRYADDLVLSVVHPDPGFFALASQIFTSAAEGQRWRLKVTKTRTWTADSANPLKICGLLVPKLADGPLRLDVEQSRAARAALHRLRTRKGMERRDLESHREVNQAHGLVAYAYAVTGDLRWLAYTSTAITNLANALAGPALSESFLAGWADDAPELGAQEER